MGEPVLVVDDEAAAADNLALFLKTRGFTVHIAYNSIDALVMAKQHAPAAVLLDIRMPGMSGTACLKQLRANYPDIKVIMTTAMDDTELAVECLQSGAFGYMVKPLSLPSVESEIKKALRQREMELQLADYQKNLETKVEAQTRELAAFNARLKSSFFTSVKLMISLVEIYDPFTGGHMRRVAALAGGMARVLNIPSPKDMPVIEIAALMHDIGTVAVPKRLRTADFSALKPEEIAIIRQHTVLAQNIMSNAEDLKASGELVRSHLEHLDGTGFPDGLKGDAIPVGARIIGTANAYDEMVHRRRFTGEPIKDQLAKEEFALVQLKKGMGRNFDPQTVAALQKVILGLRGVKEDEETIDWKGLKPDMVLARDIVTTQGLLILSHGHALTPVQIRQIQSFGEMKLLPPELWIKRLA